MTLIKTLLLLVFAAVPGWLGATGLKLSPVLFDVKNASVPRDEETEPRAALEAKNWQSNREANEAHDLDGQGVSTKQKRERARMLPKKTLCFRFEPAYNEETGALLEGEPLSLINFVGGTDEKKQFWMKPFIDPIRQHYADPAYEGLHLEVVALGTIWDRIHNAYFLDLSNMGLGNRDFGELFRMWWLHAIGGEVDMPNEQSKLVKQAFEPRGETVRSLVRLDLQNNNIGNASIECLLRLPEVFPNVRYLDLRNNNLTYETLCELVWLYYTQYSVDYLDLSGNLIDEWEEKHLEGIAMAALNERMQTLQEHREKGTLDQLTEGQKRGMQLLFFNYPCDPQRLQAHLQRGPKLVISDTSVELRSRTKPETVLRHLDLPPLEASVTTFAQKIAEALDTVFTEDNRFLSECVLEVQDAPRCALCWYALRQRLPERKKAGISGFLKVLDLDQANLSFTDQAATDNLVAFIHDLDIRELRAQNVNMNEAALKGFLARFSEKDIPNKSLRIVDLRNNPIQRRHVNQTQRYLPDFMAYREGLQFDVLSEDKGLEALITETGIEVRERLEPKTLLASFPFPKNLKESQARTGLAMSHLPFKDQGDYPYAKFVVEAQMIFKDVFDKHYPSITKCILKMEDPKKAKDFFPHLAKYWHAWKNHPGTNDLLIKRVEGDFENELDISGMPVLNEEAGIQTLFDLQQRVHLKRLQWDGACADNDMTSAIAQELQKLGVE